MAKKKKPGTPADIEKDLNKLYEHIQEQSFENVEDLQAFLNQTIGKTADEIVPEKKGEMSDKGKAQELYYEAIELPSIVEGRKLMDQVLKLDPDHADAYVYLGDTSEELEVAHEYYKKGVSAGRRAIGEKAFEELKGHFWGFHETRPFMRAKAGLAMLLSVTGDMDAAILHYQEMLELNPSDNQGIRYQVTTGLIQQNRKKEYLELYEMFKEDGSAAWLYSHALFLFKQEGASSKANKALHEAHQANPFVLQFLTGEREFPDELPPSMILGGESEAIYSINDSGSLWLDTKGALDWAAAFPFA